MTSAYCFWRKKILRPMNQAKMIFITVVAWLKFCSFWNCLTEPFVSLSRAKTALSSKPLHVAMQF